MSDKKDVDTQLSRALEYHRFRSTQNFDTRKFFIAAWAILLVAAFGTGKLGISEIISMWLLVVITPVFWIIDLIQGAGLIRWHMFINSLEMMLADNNLDKVESKVIYFPSYYSAIINNDTMKNDALMKKIRKIIIINMDNKTMHKIDDVITFFKDSATAKVLYLSQLLIISFIVIRYLFFI